jgi:hypothetical protein
MVWNKDKPSDQEKIHDLGSVIRPNWKAIEQASDSDTDAQKLKLWAVNLVDRSQPVVTGPVVPNKIGDNAAANNAEAGQVYCHNDGTFNELFFIGSDVTTPATEIQLTQDNKLGSKTTQAVVTDVTFGTDTLLNNQNAMCTAWSYVVVVGSAINVQTNYGMSWTRTSTGVYKATFTVNQVTNANYAVIGTAVAPAGDTALNVSLDGSKTRDTTTFSIDIRRSESNSTRDRSFMVAVFGGR